MDESIPQFDLIRARFDEPLFVVGGTAVTIASIVSFALFIGLAFLLSAALRRTLLAVYRGRGVDEGVAYALNRLLHYVVVVTGVVVAMDNLGVSVTALAGLGALLAVGIGFGLQNVAQNYVSGLILLLERPVKVGDYVEVGETAGTVREIGSRATVVSTLDNVDIVVPNAMFINEPVTNDTFSDRRLRVKVEVRVAYGTDPARVRAVLEHVAAGNEHVLPHPVPQVLFEDFGEWSQDFALLGWLADPLLEPTVTSDLRFAIDRAFRDAGIQIPLPQRDLHLKSGWPTPPRHALGPGGADGETEWTANPS